MMRLGLVGTTLVGLVAGAASACGDGEEVPLALASEAMLPPSLRATPAVVQQAYRFAVANPEVLNTIPCYCGCGNVGHHDNYDCYVAEAPEGGGIMFDYHAVGCGICVDITRDVMQMMRDGTPLIEIRQTIHREYSRYGPPTRRILFQ